MKALCRKAGRHHAGVRDEQGQTGVPHRRHARARVPGGALRGGGRRLGRLRSGRRWQLRLLSSNLRMAKAAAPPVHEARGQAVEAATKAHFAEHLATRHIGITLQIDEGHEVFDAKNSSLHPLFQPKA